MERWTALPLYAVATEVRDTVDPSVLGDSEVDHFAIPVLDATGRPETVAANEILSSKQRLRGGEVMISRLNPRKARVVRVPEELPRAALASGEFVVLEPRRIEPRFLTYFLLADTTLHELDSRVNSVTRSHQRIRPEVLLHLPVATPPLEEQRAIADFLDVETARIDALIDKKRRLITLLDERLSVHTAEVLHSSEADGISGTGPWPWVRLRHVASVHGGLTLGKTYSDGEPYPYLRVANVQDRRLDLADIATIDLPPSIARNFVLEPGDLLMLEGNGNPENLGRGTLWYGEIEPCLHQNHVHVVRADRSKVSPEYLDWMVRTPWARWVFAGSGQQVGIATLSQQKILDLPIPLAPRGEQARLVAALEASLAAHNDVKAKLTDQIALLEEKRRALITAAVTGEFAVPGSAAA